MRPAGRWLAALGLAAALAPRLAAQAPLFASDTPLAITLRSDFRALFRSRDDTTTWRAARLAWDDSAGRREVPVELRQRGHWRLARCDVTPLRLRFAADSVRGTLWAHARHPKLVTHCMNRDEYEQYLLLEYAAYRVYRLVTAAAFDTRLVRVTYADAGNARAVTRFGILVEDPARLAERLGGAALAIPSVRMTELRTADMATLGVFQYFIGNTDWSVPGLHNIQLIRTPDTVLAVPFDFDWTGVVNARYAYPDPRLPARTIRDRVYRGRCLGAAELEPALARFEALRDSIAALVRSIPGLSARGVENTLRYFDEFYRDIADRPRFVREVVRPTCLGG